MKKKQIRPTGSPDFRLVRATQLFFFLPNGSSMLGNRIFMIHNWKRLIAL